jgi:potassium uptake TrkH family protein
MPLSKLNRRRERINLKLFQHKEKVLGPLPYISMLVAGVAVGSIVYFFGFPQNPRSLFVEYRILQFSFAFYVLKYFINIFYDFHPLKFLKDNKFEGTIMLIMIVVFILTNIFRLNIIKQFLGLFGYPGLIHYSIIFLQLYFFIIITIEVAKGRAILSKIKIGPAQMLTLSFFILISIGAILLLLPEMTIAKNIRFIDALFTSTSACCVTGLITVDTATVFTVKGQFIIMVLIQLGCLNIICFAAFFASFLRNPSGVKYQSIVHQLFSTQSLSGAGGMIRKIVFYSLTFEIIGAVLILVLWYNSVPFSSIQKNLFYSLFHSVSAFNNAGFVLFTDGLYDAQLRFNYGVHIVIALLIIFGGIGFIVLQDLFGKEQLRDRIFGNGRRLLVHTKIVIYTSLLLILGGGLFAFILEYNNTLAEHGLGGKIIESLFQSVTCRTAGYNTVNIGMLSQSVLLVFILLMFIGASPGSTGGGIKTTTFALLFKSALATIRGKKNVEMFRHSIPFDLIDKAYSIVLFSTALICISLIALLITDGNLGFLNLLFEEISAFGTVGLTTGITSSLTDPGKYIIILTMFIGRIGPLTMALVLSKRVIFNKYRYSSVNVQVG